MSEDQIQQWFIDYQQEVSDWRNDLLSEQREDVKRYSD